MQDGEHSEQDLSLKDLGEGYGGLRLVSPRSERRMRESLERYGQMSPVVVCRGVEGGFELLDGFKRLRAVRGLGWERLRARLLDVGSRAAKAALLCLNWVTRSVSDVEEGWVVHALCRGDGLTQAEVGVLLGRDKSWVSRRLSLVERLGEEVQSQLRLGLITGTVGRELARLPRGNQERVLAAVLAHGLGSREVGRLVELLSKARREDHEQILREPREALAAQCPRPVVDSRLGRAGNGLLRDLHQMERSCGRVVSAVGIHGLSRLGAVELQVLSTALGRAERIGRQACDVLRDTQGALMGPQG